MKSKKILAIIFTFILSFGVLNIAFAQETVEVPEGYTPIYTAEDLHNIRNDLAGKYIAMNDIDLSSYDSWQPIGTADAPFTGEFNGNSMTIENLNINNESTQAGFYNFGLFGYCKNSVINNICIMNTSIEVTYFGTEPARCRVGIIAGFGLSVNVENCVVSGTIYAEGFNATEAGGIIGRNHNICNLISCVNYSNINIMASSSATAVYVGGISGVASGSKKECCNFGEIYIGNDNVNPKCEVKLGGIDGKGFEMGLVSDCYNKGGLTIDFSTSETYVGGISGDSNITRNSYNSGEISLPDNFSGYAGAISGSIGLEGWAYTENSPYVENVYYSETDLTVGYADCIHPDDYHEDSFEFVYRNFAKLSDNEMKKQSSFVGFDFESVWEMEENGYPMLQNQPVLPDPIPETTTEPLTETTTEPLTETTTEPLTETTTEPLTETTTEPLTETTTEPLTETTTEPLTETTTEPTNNLSTESTTEFPDDKSPFANLWIFRAVEWLLNSTWEVIIYLINLV